MNFELPPEDDPRRSEVRAWLDEHPNPTGRELADSGYVVPHWPKPWGLDADPLTQLIIEDELRRANVQKPINPIGTGHCGPILVMHGTEEQKRRFIPPMLSGDEDAELGVLRARRPDLLPVHHELVTVTHGTRAEVGEVRA